MASLLSSISRIFSLDYTSKSLFPGLAPLSFTPMCCWTLTVTHHLLSLSLETAETLHNINKHVFCGRYLWSYKNQTNSPFLIDTTPTRTWSSVTHTEHKHKAKQTVPQCLWQIHTGRVFKHLALLFLYTQSPSFWKNMQADHGPG